MISFKQSKINAINNMFERAEQDTKTFGWYRWSINMPYDKFIEVTVNIPGDCIKFIDIDHDQLTETVTGIALVTPEYKASLV